MTTVSSFVKEKLILFYN